MKPFEKNTTPVFPRALNVTRSRCAFKSLPTNKEHTNADTLYSEREMFLHRVNLTKGEGNPGKSAESHCYCPLPAVKKGKAK